MRKLNKKGFTMVELLAVFAIIGILAAIAIPTVLTLVNKSKIEYYKTTEKNIRIAGIEYYSQYRSERPKDNLATSQVALKTLTDKKYIEEVLDSKGKDTCSGYVRNLKKQEGKYEYTTCLVCSDYKTKNDVCGTEYDPDNNDKIYTLEAPKLVVSYLNRSVEVNKLDKAELKARGVTVKKVTAEESSVLDVDITKEAEYPDKVKYVYQGDIIGLGKRLEASSTLKIYQNSAPSVKLDKIDSSGDSTYTSGQWSNKNIKATITVKDYPSYKVADFDRLQIYNNQSNKWSDLCNKTSCSKDYAASRTLESTNRVRSIDKDGNPSKEATYVVNIDKVKPACQLETSGTLGDDGWYRSNVKVSFKAKTDEGGGILQYNVTKSSTPTYTTNNSLGLTDSTEGTNKTYGYVKDKALNEGDCSISYKIDRTVPTVTYAEGTRYDNQDLDIKITIKDNLSGPKNLKYCVTTGSSCTPSTLVNGTTTTVRLTNSSKICTYGFDKAGNQTGNICSKIYEIDRTPPMCPMISADQQANTWINQTVSLTIDPTDDTTKWIWYTKTNDDDWKEWETHNDNVTRVKTLSAEGRRQGKVRVYDEYGNNQDCDTDYFYIDKTPPACPVITEVDNRAGYPVQLKISPPSDTAVWTWDTKVNNEEWTRYETHNDNVAREKTLTAEGLRQGRVWVKDSLGNYQSCLTKQYNVNYCDSTWIDYGAWGSCSASCGGGTQYRTLYYKANYNNKACGSKQESQACNTQACSHTHEFGNSINSISGTYKNYRLSQYTYNYDWIGTCGHTHHAIKGVNAYEVQCIHCGKTKHELFGGEYTYWCPCDARNKGFTAVTCDV